MNSQAIAFAPNITQTRMVSVAQYLAVLLAFVIPLSNSLTTVVSIALLIFCLLSCERQKVLAMLKHPVMQVIALLLLLQLLGVLNTIGNNKDISMALRKSARLLYFPLLVPIFVAAKWRFYAICAFLAAILISVASAWYQGIVVFKDPIFTSLFVCFAIFILAHLVMDHPRYKYILGSAAICATYYLLFLNTGRTGQVLFFMLFVLFCWQRLPRFKDRMIAGLLLIAVLGSSIMLPSSFISRQRVAALEVRDYIQKDELALPHTSSMGMRLIFAHNSLELIKMKPVFGWGTGGFREAYKQYAPEAQAREVVRTNPHNQYLLTWVELGLPGILGLLLLFGTLAWQFLRVKSTEAYLGLGFVCAIAVGCTVNSWLLDFASMFFFILFASVFAAAVYAEVS